MNGQSSLDNQLNTTNMSHIIRLHYFVMNNRANLNARHRHCITERTQIPLVFKHAMSSLNLLARLLLVWVQWTSWHRDLRYGRTTPSVWNDDYFSLLIVNCMRYEKSPYITCPGPPTTATFSSKGQMKLLISRFEPTENPKEKELMGAKSII